MIYIGIDVAKSKHDCFITNSDGEVLIENMTFPNSLEGFSTFSSIVKSFSKNLNNIKVGLEATGHYSNNLLEFLYSNGFSVYVLNPLSTNLFRKGQSLRKTKTDKTDAKMIALMIMSQNLKPYIPLSYHIKELKSLSRHRFRLVQYRSKLKVSYGRILDIIFPELNSAVWSTSQNSMLHTLLELPGASAIAHCHLTKLTSILHKSSKGKYTKEKAIELKNLAKESIGDSSQALAFELQQTIRLILFIQDEIKLLEKQIKTIVLELDSPILSIPGISYVTAAIILSEIGDIKKFDSSSKLLAFAGLEPSTHQSGNYISNHSVMVKRGSTYLRWALLTATRLICMRDETFNAYKDKKISEGKHYFVALGHTSKKLVRLIFHLLKTNQVYQSS